MRPEDFVKQYETALSTQEWSVIEPLISEQASVTFSDGSVHVGIGEIQIAYEKNFATIKGEKYTIDVVNWLKKSDTYAVYLFEYNWAGLINGKLVSGGGVGTAVLVSEQFRWKLLTEHLGRRT